MRVVGGAARGRLLRAKLPAGVRPTTDRAREAIFSMLESRGGLEGLTVVDLYCGSGALGIEALSRGAAVVHFIDQDPACLEAARANLAPLGLAGEARYVRAALPQWTAVRCDLVLADPPYGPLDVTPLLSGTGAARAVIENNRTCDAPPGWRVAKSKRYGTTLVTMLESITGAP